MSHLKVGSDLVFVPLVVDPAIIKQLAKAFDGRSSVMAMPGAPSAAELLEAGVQHQLKGQHAYLFTDDTVDFYRKLGFVEQPVGLGQVVGNWLVNHE